MKAIMVEYRLYNAFNDCFTDYHRIGIKYNDDAPKKAILKLIKKQIAKFYPEYNIKAIEEWSFGYDFKIDTLTSISVRITKLEDFFDVVRH